jgi:two-component system phosphate regulon sensor histidine kinase PhoR
MRVDFIANASHELRTPLASLLGFIETLQGPARNDAAARERFLEIMREQARRMTRLIDDLLSLSRIELRAHVPPKTPVELEDLVRQMADTLSPMAVESGAEIVVAVGTGPFVVLGDRDELLRVVENLIGNAIKYGASGGRIDVRLAHSGEGRIGLGIADRGPGIDPEHLPRLTERFYRVDTATSRAKGGTGLGLAIVKHILNRHGGTLRIDSRPGHGATFTVTLPDHGGAVPHRHSSVIRES